MTGTTLLCSGLLLLFGFVLTSDLRGTYRRYVDVAALVDGYAEGRTAVGAVDVETPARPARKPPAVGADHGSTSMATDGDRPPAIWAWRIRERTSADGDREGTRWTTVDGGLAVGSFTVVDDREHARVDRESATNAAIGPLHGADDPFEAPGLHVSDPTIDVPVEAPIDDPHPTGGLLGRSGLHGIGGPFGTVDRLVGLGRGRTSTRRYQATVVHDGDEVFVAGERHETGGQHPPGEPHGSGTREPPEGGAMLRGTATTPMVVARGDPARKRRRLRRVVRRKAAIATVTFAVAVAVTVSAAV